MRVRVFSGTLRASLTRHRLRVYWHTGKSVWTFYVGVWRPYIKLGKLDDWLQESLKELKRGES